MIENIGAYSKVDYDRGYQQGRADAIDECEKAIDKVFLYTDNKGIDRYADYCQVNRNSLMNYLEQLKEQTK